VVGQLKAHVSYSEVRQFNQCEWKWYLNQILKQQVEERALAMEFGSAIHSALELMYGPEKLSVDEASWKALEEFEKNLVGLELTENEGRELMKLTWLVSRILNDCTTNEDLQGIVPLKTELRIMEPIARTDGLDIKFKGFVDFIFQKKLKRKTVIYIADFKTCQWGWLPQKLMDPEVCAQILLYKYFFCRLTGIDPRDVTCAFILLKKNPRPGDSHVQVCKVGGGPKALDAAIEYVQSTITRMHSGSYRMNTDSCIFSWTDRATDELREIRCPYLNTDLCTVGRSS
jgi:hypothetical protein